MTEPPHDGGQGQPGGSSDGPQGPASSDPGSPDYAGAPDDAPRRGAHRAGARPTPPPPPPAGAPYWPTPPDAPPGGKLKQPLADTLPLRLLQVGGALLGVIALVLVLYLLFHKGSNGETNQGAGKTTAAQTTGAATPAGTTSGATTTGGASATSQTTPSSTQGKTASPTATPTARPTTSKPTTKPTTAKPTVKPTTAKPTAKPTTVAPPPAAVKAPLLVLNNSRIHGLAITGAAAFRKGGWTVVDTGNFIGRLPQTTVYYAPGYRAAAETLARQFPTVTSVQARPAGVPASAPLTVVLTRYFKP